MYVYNNYRKIYRLTCKNIFTQNAREPFGNIEGACSTLHAHDVCLLVCVLRVSYIRPPPPNDTITIDQPTSQLRGTGLSSQFKCPLRHRPRWTSCCGVAPLRWPAHLAPICSSPGSCVCMDVLICGSALYSLVFNHSHLRTVCVRLPSTSLCVGAESSHAHWNSSRIDRPAEYPPN